MVYCSKCNGKTQALITFTDFKSKELYRYRYRKCLNCGHRFYTTAKYIESSGVKEVEEKDSKSKFYKEMYLRKKDDSQ